MTAWPPPELGPIRDKMAEWDAWLSGDRARLESAGQGQGGNSVGASGSTDARFGEGVVSRVWRRFWGKSSTKATDPTIKVHCPLAADIARASSDLLFAEPPTITADTPERPDLADGLTPPVSYALALAAADATTARLVGYLDQGLIGVLAGGAEVGAGLGGVYFRATWDTAAQRVFAVRIDADAAIPEFDYGRLRRVTFFRQLSSDRDRVVIRHLEVHEVANMTPVDAESGAAGPADMVGVIRHELWQGTRTDLGHRVPITEDIAPGLATLVPLLIDGDTITTGTPGLDVVYIPNVTPNLLWRNNPAGAYLGAPDIAGAEDFLDRLDGVMSSLLEEVDLAKARIIIPEAWLTSGGRGQGMSFDADRRVFTTISVPPNDTSSKAELFQPAIRVDELLRVAQELTEVILRRAGYSAATFGEDEDGGAATATEVNSKTARSRLTRNRKIRHWQPALVDLLVKMLSIDKAMGWADPMVDPTLVSVQFPQAAQTPLEIAQTVALWNQAAAVSTWTKVAALHPDWDETQIEQEINRIREDLGMANPVLTDPTQLGVNGDGLAAGLSPEEIAVAANAMGVLIRAGVDPDDAATRVGLAGIDFTGAMPTSLRLPEKDAAKLEPA